MAAMRVTIAEDSAVLREGLAAAVEDCAQLEIETYTWSVLPSRMRPGDDAQLVYGIAAEVEFTASELASLGFA